jgi:DNA-binding CsgD family transcriptional regulator
LGYRYVDIRIEVREKTPLQGKLRMDGFFTEKMVSGAFQDVATLDNLGRIDRRSSGAIRKRVYAPRRRGRIGFMSDQPSQRGTQLVKGRPDLCEKLSDAQLRVLEYLLEGVSEPKIAQQISRSRHTVHDHTKAIYQALNVNSRVQLVLLFSQPAKQ